MTCPAGTPFWLQCPACGHRWVACHLPLDVDAFVSATMGARCPRCGDDRPTLARQADGALTEHTCAPPWPAPPGRLP